ncbi:MAG: SMODS domain-containing nucleotidyltransferase [Thermoplasmatota archaeon]
MELPTHFQRFHRNIQLNEEREAKVRRALDRFSEFLGRDQLGNYMVSAPVPQGSYAQGTIVCPLGRNPDYDVDILLPLDLDRLMRERELRNGNEVFAYLHKRLKTEYKAGKASMYGYLTIALLAVPPASGTTQF